MVMYTNNLFVTMVVFGVVVLGVRVQTSLQQFCHCFKGLILQENVMKFKTHSDFFLAMSNVVHDCRAIQGCFNRDVYSQV